jgi:uncharacterized membrane protein
VVPVQRCVATVMAARRGTLTDHRRIRSRFRPKV